MLTYRNLPLVALRSFEATTRHMSIKDAASELGVTPGAVSQQIKSLENHVCVPLFIRGHRQLMLTSEGALLNRTLGHNFAEIQQALEQISSGPGSRKIRLKLLPSLAIRWLVPRLADFYGKHSGFDVEVATGMTESDEAFDDADFSCRLGNGNWKGMLAVRLFADAFLPVCSATLAAKIKQPSDMLEYPLLHSMMRMDAWDIWFTKYGGGLYKPKHEVSFANAAIAYQAAEDGLGIAIAQKSYVESDLACGRLVAPFKNAVPTSLSYYLVCALSKSQQTKNQVFIDWIKETVGK